ncbi:GNAT family acetyltransferase [Ligilactobacillus salitolerans]|uniref:GNAT family acetyltransferase n=1 Tax=Ligilactobacillus salitolerans TaxID=1808352 RepID=A0A401IUR7_9LACO|nr:GNAT family N-acetyltransferase [Ligilactobacillus salitolerans]GBG95272.1 GNAT family acetyltransferase [Ligilactobacillus salitolerans]
MSLTFGPAQEQDLDIIMQIEQTGFSPAEAASKESMLERIKVIPDTFIVAYIAGRPVGYVVGPVSTSRYITDDLFAQVVPNKPSAPYQTILSLAVAPEYRSQGVGGQLLAQLAGQAQKHGQQALTLTCLQELIPFYEKNFYKNEGLSSSTHANEAWYNMIRPLNEKSQNKIL